MIPLDRTFVFAELRVGTVDRLDLDSPSAMSLRRASRRHEGSSGGQPDHASNLVVVAEDVDGFVKSHLAAAYDLGDRRNGIRSAGAATHRRRSGAP
jgi:hypothetical protein